MSNEQKKAKTGNTFAQRLVMVSCTALVILAILAGAAWGLYRLALAHTSHAGAVLWALGATALIPVSDYVCYRLGQTESKGTLNGLAAGVSAVMKAANETANLKVNVTHALRQPAQPQVIELPALPPVRRYSSLDAGDVIDV